MEYFNTISLTQVENGWLVKLPRVEAVIPGGLVREFEVQARIFKKVQEEDKELENAVQGLVENKKLKFMKLPGIYQFDSFEKVLAFLSKQIL